jgi:hypothetical protein
LVAALARRLKIIFNHNTKVMGNIIIGYDIFRGMITMPNAPPSVAQHAIVWIMNEWNDPRRHRSMRRECDDIMNPYAAHPECNRISGLYREGVWLITVSAQTMNSHDRVHVSVGHPAYNPREESSDYANYVFTQRVRPDGK